MEHIKTYFVKQVKQSIDTHKHDHKATDYELNSLTVASLNFSGVNTNPFEYDDGSEMMKEINSHCKEMIDAELPGMTKWLGAKIDKDYHVNRLSVCFGEPVVLVQDKLPNRLEFANIWKTKFTEANYGGKFGLAQKAPTPEVIQNLVTMDYIFYRSVILYVYKIKQKFDKIEQIIKTLDPTPLNAFIKGQWLRPSCQSEIKKKVTLNYLQKKNLDILFLQQCSSVDWDGEQLNEYKVVRCHDSAVIYKRSSLGTLKELSAEEKVQFQTQLDFNDDTCVLVTNKNEVIISSHLVANNENLKQAEDLFAKMDKLLERHPRITFIIGMDANHYVARHPPYDIVPIKPDKPTSVKKRTYMQAQYNKAGKSITEVKDVFITNRKITEFQIEEVGGNESTDALLPNDKHPFDHFILFAKVA